jgi:signal transduction histidine kinase/putative methionine-R-sulfoxide reductase with GAF domain
MGNPSDKKFALLSRVVEISNSNIQIENRLKYICDFLARESGAECVCVYRRDPRGEYLIPWVSSCLEIEECTRFDFRIRPGEGVAGKAVQKRAPVYFPDVQASPPSLSVAREIRDFRSILSVPIMDDVYLYGALNFSSRSPLTFSEETVRLLSAVATEVAGAIRNSRLYHDARKRVSELITLNEIGRAITSTFQVREILDYVAKTTSRLLQSDGCTIRLAGGSRAALKVMVDAGYEQPAFKREMRAHGKVLANRIVREKRPLLINEPEGDPMHLALSRHGVISFLGLPIVCKGRTLGVISYYSCSPHVVFDMEVMHLMETVCSQLANMIENSAMFREAQQLAHENQARAQRFATLYNVARALMSTVKTERLLQIMLYALISPEGLNFSRAILFLLSDDGRMLAARMGMGPRDVKEARRTRRSRRVLPEEGGTEAGMKEIGKMLWRDMEGLSLPLGNPVCLVAKAVREKRAIRTDTGCKAPAGEPPEGLCGNHPPSFVTVPLVVHGEARGSIYVDNKFREREITEEDIQILTMFASEACLAMENASLVENLEDALEKVRKTQDRLVQSEKLAALGEMAARIAHEIKNPLTVIGGFAARLARRETGGGYDHPPAGKYAEIILKEVKRLERTVQQTLYFSRGLVSAFRPLDINTEVLDILAMFRDELEEGGIEKAVNFSENIPEIHVDPDQIRQVLWNLVSNAIQAMGEGGRLTLVTRPASEDEGDGVVFLIGDTGGGIPHDVVHNIFNPFFTTKPEGTGLGLPIVHAIVQNHGGTIHLDNREGEGVTFSIFLPREPKEKGTGGRILEQMRKGERNGTLVREHSG